MNIKPFLLSFTITALVASPFIVSANDPVREIAVAPAPGTTQTYGGVNFDTTITRGASTATININANNPGSAFDEVVEVRLMKISGTGPMTRMAPMPSEVAQKHVRIKVANKGRVSERVKVSFSKELADEFERERTRVVQPGFEMMTPSPTTFFVTISAIASTVTKNSDSKTTRFASAPVRQRAGNPSEQ